MAKKQKKRRIQWGPAAIVIAAVVTGCFQLSNTLIQKPQAEAEQPQAGTGQTLAEIEQPQLGTEAPQVTTNVQNSSSGINIQQNGDGNNSIGGGSVSGLCSGNTIIGNGNVVVCNSDQGSAESFLENEARQASRPQNWKQQLQLDIQGDFYGCAKGSPNMVLCSVELTNDGTDQKTLQVRTQNTWLREKNGDIYKAHRVKIVGEQWNNYMAYSKVNPGRSRTFHVSFLVKPSATIFDELELKLNSSIGSPEFIFYPG